MASGIFAVLDDIATLMDDVAVAAKVATKKAAGILGDDLAVNAEKSTGFVSSRELPVLWKITKGSLLNKLIIIPIVFLLNIFLPIAIKIILMLGGVYLAFEGVEKIIEFLFHRKHKDTTQNIDQTTTENAIEEDKKVKSAIKTDFILSVEIVIIALAAVIDQTLTIRILAVVVTSLVATVGVYGFVAIIVRMDDVGFVLIKKSKNKGLLFFLGNVLVKALPYIVKAFSVIGTIALLLVSGGLFLHNLEILHHYFHHWPVFLSSILIGIVVGLVAVAIFQFGKIIFQRKKN